MPKLSKPQRELVETIELLNSKVAWVTEVGVFSQRTRKPMSPETFAMQYANLPDVGKSSAVSAWKKSPIRKEYADVKYDPSGKTELFNLYTGWGCESKKGDIRPWQALLDHLFGKDKEERERFERWLGYPIAHPGTKLKTAYLMWSLVEGVGKGTVAECMEAIYGSANVNLTVTEKVLNSIYTGWLVNKQFIGVPETMLHDKRNLMNGMKDLITNETVDYNEKYAPSYRTNSCANFFFQSNHLDALSIGHGDRRLHIYEVKSGKLPQGLAERVHDWIRSKVGPPALRYYFEHFNFGDFNPHAPAPLTADKLAMVQASRYPLEDWVSSLRDDPDTKLFTWKQTEAKTWVKAPLKWRVATSQEIAALAAAQFYQENNPETQKRCTKDQLARLLRSIGLKKANGGAQIWIDAITREYLWILRDHDQVSKMTPKRLAALYREDRK